MPKAPPKADGRTLVDQFLDRIKNNRVAAVIIIICVAVGALASLTDSTKKLSEALSSFSKSDLTGEWASDTAEFYPVGPEVLRLRLREAAGGQVLGSVQFSDPQNASSPREFEILEGKREGRKLSISFDSGGRLYQGGEGKSVALRETVTGEIAGSQLRLVYQREGHAGVPVNARRVQP
jgi:hypothetical protein